MAYQPKPYDIAGFDIYGERQPDGSIKIGPPPAQPESRDERTHLPDFPDSIEVCGAVYTLEYVKPNEISDKMRARLSPERLAHQETICWGIYV